MNSVTVPKNVKRGTLSDFLRSIVLQNIEANEGERLWWNPKKIKVALCRKKFEKNTKNTHVIEVLYVDVFFVRGSGVLSMVGGPLFKLMLNKSTKKWTDCVELTKNN